MSISSLRLMAAAAAVTGGLAIASGPVAAQECYPPVPGCGTTVPPVVLPGPTLTLSDKTVFHGQTIRASVTGFQPGTTGIVTIASVEQQIGAFAVGTDGTSSTSVTIPVNLTLGGHTVFAKGTALNGAPGVASQAVTVFAVGVSAQGGGASLARTGVFVIPTALIGAGLVAGGVALKRSSRRGNAKTFAKTS